MPYFSGFGFCNEAELFESFIPQSDTCVAGFSYGAQRAVTYALEAPQRIDRVVLLSPAFFNDKNEAFIRTQLRYFRKDRDAYMSAFIDNVVYGCDMDVSAYMCETNIEELERLLRFHWRNEAIETLRKRGIVVEVFLGGRDRIVDTGAAYDFFAPLADATYLIDKAGHLLCSGSD